MAHFTIPSNSSPSVRASAVPLVIELLVMAVPPINIFVDNGDIIIFICQAFCK